MRDALRRRGLCSSMGVRRQVLHLGCRGCRLGRNLMGRGVATRPVAITADNGEDDDQEDQTTSTVADRRGRRAAGSRTCVVRAAATAGSPRPQPKPAVTIAQQARPRVLPRLERLTTVRAGQRRSLEPLDGLRLFQDDDHDAGFSTRLVSLPGLRADRRGSWRCTRRCTLPPNGGHRQAPRAVDVRHGQVGSTPGQKGCRTCRIRRDDGACSPSTTSNRGATPHRRADHAQARTPARATPTESEGLSPADAASAARRRTARFCASLIGGPAIGARAVSRPTTATRVSNDGRLLPGAQRASGMTIAISISSM